MAAFIRCIVLQINYVHYFTTCSVYMHQSTCFPWLNYIKMTSNSFTMKTTKKDKNDPNWHLFCSVWNTLANVSPSHSPTHTQPLIYWILDFLDNIQSQQFSNLCPVKSVKQNEFRIKSGLAASSGAQTHSWPGLGIETTVWPCTRLHHLSVFSRLKHSPGGRCYVALL